jgi:hypothetical protein
MRVEAKEIVSLEKHNCTKQDLTLWRDNMFITCPANPNPMTSDLIAPYLII